MIVAAYFARRNTYGRASLAELDQRLLISLFVINTHPCFHCPFSSTDTFFHANVAKDFFSWRFALDEILLLIHAHYFVQINSAHENISLARSDKCAV